MLKNQQHSAEVVLKRFKKGEPANLLQMYVESLEKTAQQKLNLCLPYIMTEFKKSFITEFLIFQKEATALAQGKLANIDGWKDKLAEFGIGAGSVIAGAVVAALGALGLISLVITTGIGVAIAVFGLGIGIGYGVYKTNRDKKEYRRAERLFHRKHVENDIAKTADLLATIYAGQLAQCTPKDAVNLAKSCVSAISKNMLKNKTMRFNELLHPVLLQGMLMKYASYIPNTELQLITANSKKIHTRDMISRAALYCKENDKFYSCPSSKPTKYGTLFFSTKKEIKEFQSLVEKLHKHPDKWKYTKLQPAQGDMLKNDAFFKVIQADKSQDSGSSDDTEKSTSSDEKCSI